MKKKKDILYIDCGMGAAGDMLAAALFELVPDKEKMCEKLNDLLPEVEFKIEAMQKCGINGTHINVIAAGEEENAADVIEGDIHLHSHGTGHHHSHETGHHHSEDEERQSHSHDHNVNEQKEHHSHHAHRGMKEIEEIIQKIDVRDTIKKNVLDIYSSIAEAESRAHGVDVSKIHFHEVGMLDAIADITAVCLLIEELDPGEIISSPIRTGFGHVHCAHGILPVPAPATEFLLQGIPSYGGDLEGELCTPTGAALIRYFAGGFGSRPEMISNATGYGMGKKDFEYANCVRITKGEITEGASGEKKHSDKEDKKEDVIYTLSCNIDDMTAEEMAFAVERLFEGGAKDVYTLPIGMKKGRPGTMFCILCDEAKKDELIKLMFKHTTTLGIREDISKRYILDRDESEINTPAGMVRIKTSTGFGTEKEKYEYEDIAKIAKQKDISLKEVKSMTDDMR